MKRGFSQQNKKKLKKSDFSLISIFKLKLVYYMNNQPNNENKARNNHISDKIRKSKIEIVVNEG